MKSNNALKQIKAFAGIEGLWMGLVWTVSFAFMVYMPQSLWGNLMLLSTPFFAGWRLQQFRNNALDGAISFRRAFVFLVYVFFYGSLIFAAAQFVYFRFLDEGRFLSMLSDAVNAILPLYKANGIDGKELSASVELMTGMNAIDLTLLFMLQNIMIGILLSVPVAAVCKKRNSNAGIGSKQ